MKQIIDMILVGNNLDRPFIHTLVSKAEKFISRKVKYIVLSQEEMIRIFNNKPALLIWWADTRND